MAASNSSDLTATNNDGGDTTQHPPPPPLTDDQRRPIDLLIWNLSSSSDRGNYRFPSTSDQPNPLGNILSNRSNYSFPVNTVTAAVTEILENTGAAVNQSFNAAINPIFGRGDEILENQETEDFKNNSVAMPGRRIANDYPPPLSTLIGNYSFSRLSSAQLLPTPSNILESRIGNYIFRPQTTTTAGETAAVLGNSDSTAAVNPSITAATNPIDESSAIPSSVFSPSHVDSTKSLPVTTAAATTVSGIFDNATNPIVESSDLGIHGIFSSDKGSFIDFDHDQEIEIFNSALVTPRPPRVDYEYPPPAMSTLNRNGRSRFTYRILREDGRLVVRMARNNPSNYIVQHREGGHLKMTLVPNQNSDQEAEKDTIDNDDGGEDDSQKKLLKTIPLVFIFFLAFFIYKN